MVRTMKHIKTYLLAALLTGAAISCMDDTLQYSEYHPGPGCGQQDGDKDMRLKVSVPRTYGSKSGSGSLSREERIDTLDVLVFAPGTDGKMYLRASATGSEVKDDAGNIVANVFEVVMPLGRDMDVHVFANSHRDLMRSGAFGNIGKEMQTVLGMVTHCRHYAHKKTTSCCHARLRHRRHGGQGHIDGASHSQHFLVLTVHNLDLVFLLSVEKTVCPEHLSILMYHRHWFLLQWMWQQKKILLHRA